MKKSSYTDFGKSKSEFANMPREYVQGEYPKQEGLGSDIDDTITGIDETVSHAKGKVKKHLSNQK